jgi:hypothetical protein
MKNYAFIDAQNLNLGVSKDIRLKNNLVYKGWKLDLRKFHIYLEQKYQVKKTYLFIGYIKQYEEMYEQFRQ